MKEGYLLIKIVKNTWTELMIFMKGLSKIVAYKLNAEVGKRDSTYQ